LALNVCQLLASREDGGLERHFLELCGALARAGCRVTAVADPRFAPALETAGVRFVALSMAPGRRNPAQLLRLYRLLRASRCDLIHAQANRAAAMLAPLRRWLPVPAVATVHGIKRGRRGLRRFDRVVAVSRSVADSLQGLNPTVIENGIEPPAPVDAGRVTRLRAAFAGDDGLPLVLACGRLVEVKGFDLLIDAWRDVNAQLVIAGDGPLRAALAARIDAAGLGAKVRLLGERADVPALMAAADLFVLSSRREGLPYVLLEALHARRPVVATRTGGAVDLLPAACLADVGDSGALARCVAQALHPASGCRRGMSAAWERARRELTLDAMAARHLALYSELCHGR
jgi:glycosyltransferase involved in cell wall biosynthesis